MGVNVRVDGLMVIAGLAVAAGVVIYWNRKAIGQALDKVNPASSNNLVNQGVNTLAETVSGKKGCTLGTALYDWMNPDSGLAPSCW